jgi:hypothetical protein
VKRYLMLSALMLAFSVQVGFAKDVDPDRTVCGEYMGSLHNQAIGNIVSILPMRAAKDGSIALEGFDGGNIVKMAPDDRAIVDEIRKFELPVWRVYFFLGTPEVVSGVVNDRPESVLKGFVADLVLATRENGCLWQGPQPLSLGVLDANIVANLYVAHSKSNQPDKDLSLALKMSPEDLEGAIVRDVTTNLKDDMLAAANRLNQQSTGGDPLVGQPIVVDGEAPIGPADTACKEDLANLERQSVAGVHIYAARPAHLETALPIIATESQDLKIIVRPEVANAIERNKLPAWLLLRFKATQDVKKAASGLVMNLMFAVDETTCQVADDAAVDLNTLEQMSLTQMAMDYALRKPDGTYRTLTPELVTPIMKLSVAELRKAVAEGVAEAAQQSLVTPLPIAKPQDLDSIAK